jgi:hypothetical protein
MPTNRHWHKSNQNRLLWLSVVLSTVTLTTAADLPAQDKSELAPYFGFRRSELFKLNARSSNLLATDLNQDRLTDLILIDNSNSRLDLLQQRNRRPEAVAAAEPKINAIENDWRFEHRKISVDKSVSTLAVGDFNSDGRKDLVYFGAPDQLVIRLQTTRGDWSPGQRFRLPEVQPSAWNLAAGDLNGDQKDDVVVVGKHETYLIFQGADGQMAPPTKLLNSSENVGLVQIADVDGDGRNDLCYLNQDDQERALCVRLQGKSGLGPEVRCDLNRPRGVTLANVDGKPGQEVLAIDAQSGRVRVYQLQRPEFKAGELAGQLIQYGFGKQGAGKDRDLAMGDIDGDGLTDVVVTDPESSQLLLFRQSKESGLDLGNSFPGLVGASQVRVADLDGDRKAEVIVLSTRETTIGISKLENGRLTFPQSLKLLRDPVAIEVADLNQDGKPEIAYIGRERTSSASKFTLLALSRDATGNWNPVSFGDKTELALSLKGDPERIMQFDVNADGRPEFLVFQGERPPLVLTSDGKGNLSELKADGGLSLGKVTPGGLFFGQLDQPVILAAQNNFARSLKVNEQGQWQVVDQYNAAESEARIVGAATIDLDLQPGREIVLVDTGTKRLRILRKEGAVYRPWREVEIGAFPYKSTHVADLNGDGRDDLLLFGSGKFGVLYAGQSDPKLKMLAEYETKLEKVHFNDLAAGDLNNDGRVDIAVIDTQSQYIEILDFSAEAGLRHGLHFKVFEAKSLNDNDATGADPRELVIADVTGDGLNDLILLTHDRVLVYPQDDGKPDPVAAGK